MPKYYIASCNGNFFHIKEGKSPKDALVKFLKSELEYKQKYLRYYAGRKGVMFNLKGRHAWTFTIRGNEVNNKTVTIKHRGVLDKFTAGQLQKGTPPHYVKDWTDLKHTEVRFM